MELNGRRVINAEVDGVDSSDYPDFCDAYFCYATFEDGTELTDAELEQLTDENGDVVNEMCFDCMTGWADDAYDRYKDSLYE
jgi:hypothetical protein